MLRMVIVPAHPYDDLPSRDGESGVGEDRTNNTSRMNGSSETIIDYMMTGWDEVDAENFVCPFFLSCIYSKG